MEVSRKRKIKHYNLIDQCDDLFKKAKILSIGCETEFLTFVKNQEEVRLKWLEAEQKRESLLDKNKKLQAEVGTLETHLKHARLQAEYELKGRKTAEQEKDEMDHQLGVIRTLLMDKNSKSIIHEADKEKINAFTNSQRQSMYQGDLSSSRLNTIMEHSASVLSDVSFDKTEEDPLGDSKLRSGRKYRRPSAPPAEPENDENMSYVTATIIVDGGKPTGTIETNIPKLNKSFSEPNLDKHGNSKRDSDVESDDEVWMSSNVNANNVNTNAKPRKSILKSAGAATPETPALRKASSAGRGLNRVHIFISKTVIKPETCVPCGKRIRFSKPAMKCKECRAVCHPECKDKIPLPCIPSCPSTPGPNRHIEGYISDFAPAERPMIPRLIVNCANEIEFRGLDEVGVYRIPGSERDVKELKDKFIKDRHPNLSNIHDIHVVCGCLKDFLRGLKEPLVTHHFWDKFVRSADLMSEESSIRELQNLIIKLPQANQDTLAFLCQHLQTVASSPACKMPLSNLAKVFGPTVVGFSVPDPEPGKIISETHKQAQVMERLLHIPHEFWSQLLCVDDISLYPALTPNTPNTPEHFASPYSRLGPLHTPDVPERYVEEVSTYGGKSYRTQTTPKYSVRNRESRRPARFFASPVVN